MPFALELSADWMMASMLVGSVGVGLFVYGKKQASFPHFLAGIALIAESSLVPSIGWMLASAGVAVLVLIGVVRMGR
jgi:hypothetical protein